MGWYSLIINEKSRSIAFLMDQDGSWAENGGRGTYQYMSEGAKTGKLEVDVKVNFLIPGIFYAFFSLLRNVHVSTL